MPPPKRWTPGDPITAERLNQSVFEAVIPRREVVLGNGSTLVNESLGNQTANMRRHLIKMVVATTDFAVSATTTDLNTGVLDDVPSGLVREVRLNRKTGTHAEDTLSGEFRAWDPLSGLSGVFCPSDSASASASASASNEASTSSKIICDVFYVMFNEDSKRWEVLSGTGAGGVRDIGFQIVSAFPASLTAYGEIKSWDYGFSSSDVPAQFGVQQPPLELRVVEICDVAGCFFNEPDEELIGRMGRARYSQGTASHCRVGSAPYPGVWEVYSLCCLHPSCDVVF